MLKFTFVHALTYTQTRAHSLSVIQLLSLKIRSCIKIQEGYLLFKIMCEYHISW